MRIVVFGDSHGLPRMLNRVVERHRENADCFLFLGDGLADCLQAARLNPGLTFHMVSGNCDFMEDLPPEGLLDCGQVKVFYTHGHLYHVKSGPEQLLQAARRQGAQVALFGHTHRAFSAYEQGVHLLNPGSLSQPREGRPSYGVVDLTPQGIVCYHVEL